MTESIQARPLPMPGWFATFRELRELREAGVTLREWIRYHQQERAS